MDESRRQRSSRRPRATEEQLRARREAAEARAKSQERKRRTRQLIQLGGVCAHYGFTKPDQVDELMASLARRDAWVEWLRDKQGVELPNGDGR